MEQQCRVSPPPCPPPKGGGRTQEARGTLSSPESVPRTPLKGTAGRGREGPHPPLRRSPFPWRGRQGKAAAGEAPDPRERRGRVLPRKNLIHRCGGPPSPGGEGRGRQGNEARKPSPDGKAACAHTRSHDPPLACAGRMRSSRRLPPHPRISAQQTVISHFTLQIPHSSFFVLRSSFSLPPPAPRLSLTSPALCRIIPVKIFT